MVIVGWKLIEIPSVININFKDDLCNLFINLWFLVLVHTLNLTNKLMTKLILKQENLIRKKINKQIKLKDWIKMEIFYMCNIINKNIK